jgi:ADP-dependent NAD(P)H-hydrate dehydratase / NAD(P)H-hydrate epimerase
MDTRFPVVSGPEMGRLDRLAIDSGMDSLLLMENAGSAVAKTIVDRVPHTCPVLVVCGTGNNGADGLVVARKLAAVWFQVDVVLIGPMKSVEGERNLQILRNSFDGVSFYDSIGGVDDHVQYSVIVDAVLGAGSTRSRREKMAQTQNVFDWMNARRKLNSSVLVAVDLPSGVDPSTGELLFDRPVLADITVTFGAIKTGIWLYPGREFCGEFIFSKISFPPKILSNSSFYLYFPTPLLPRDPNGHKGSFGKATFLAGSATYFGAPFFCTAGFLKSGGGYARLCAADRAVGESVAAKLPEIVLGDSSSGWSPDAVVIGPGLGLENQALFGGMIKRVLEGGPIRVVIDGDGYGLLLEKVEVLSRLLNCGHSVILTPHYGEYKRLFWPPENTSPLLPHSEAVPENFFDSVQTLRRILSVNSDSLNSYPGELIFVMKGARTAVVSSKSLDRRISLNVTGNSGMGTAGSGDVLAGIIAAIRGQSVLESVRLAVFIHGLAGDLARDDLGEDGMLASDILAHVPAAMKLVRRMGGSDEWLESYYPVESGV